MEFGQHQEHMQDIDDIGDRIFEGLSTVSVTSGSQKNTNIIRNSHSTITTVLSPTKRQALQRRQENQPQSLVKSYVTQPTPTTPAAAINEPCYVCGNVTNQSVSSKQTQMQTLILTSLGRTPIRQRYHETLRK